VSDNKWDDVTQLVKELAFEHRTVIFAKCSVLACRMCGGTDVLGPQEGTYFGYKGVQHADYCPVGKLLGWKKAVRA
jgi:hypothetical protein